MNPNPDNQHFIREQKEKSFSKFYTGMVGAMLSSNMLDVNEFHLLYSGGE